MATIITRAGKGSPLTNNEVDNNFTNLNSDKLESGDTVASLTLTSADINGGTIDGVTLGTNSAVTEAQIDNININGNAITSTDTDGNIALTPNGTGEVDISKVDIDGGTIDGTVIGGSTPAAISGTTGTFSGNLTVDTDTLFVGSANNRVGIGTSSPDEDLHVESSNFATIKIESTGASSDPELNFTNDNGGASAWSLRLDKSASDVFQLRYNNSAVMTVDTSGDVGIGTSSPSALLHLSSSNTVIRLTDSDDDAYHTVIASSDDLYISSDAGNTGDGNMIFRNGGSSERMRIDSSGTVTINEGTVVLNGSTISAIQVTVADDAVAELTFTNRRFGMLSLVEGSDDDVFPDISAVFFGYIDFGDSPIISNVFSGNDTDRDTTNTLTGTTGVDGKLTIGAAGTSGTLYIENRRGSARVFNVTLM